MLAMQHTSGKSLQQCAQWLFEMPACLQALFRAEGKGRSIKFGNETGYMKDLLWQTKTENYCGHKTDTRDQH